MWFWFYPSLETPGSSHEPRVIVRFPSNSPRLTPMTLFLSPFHALGTNAFSETRGAMQLLHELTMKKVRTYPLTLIQCFTSSSHEWSLRHFTVVSSSPYAKPLHSGFGSQILFGTVWKHPPFPVPTPKGCESEIRGNKQPKVTVAASPTGHEIFHNHLKTLRWRQLISISSKKLHLLNAEWTLIPPKGWELPKLYYFQTTPFPHRVGFQQLPLSRLRAARSPLGWLLTIEDLQHKIRL